MRHLTTTLVLFLVLLSPAAMAQDQMHQQHAELDLLFIAKIILAAIIALVGISALRAYLKQEE